MRSASDIADEAINKIDNDDAGGDKPADTPADQPKDKPADKPADDKDKKDDKPADSPAPKYDKDGNRIEDKPADKPADEDKDKDADEFTADDSEEVDEPAAPAAPGTDTSGVQLSDQERKYIVDNIGEPLTITGMRGDKEVTIKVFTPQQIPADFKFGSDAALLAAQNGLAGLERKAEQLLGNFRNNASQEQAKDYEKRENEGIRQDVADLQKSGDFPKFKVQPGQPGFDDDPGAQQMTEVLKIMAERNDQYLKEYNQGRPYKHIGFAEAFDIYRRDKGTDTKKDEQDAEDKERKTVGDKIGSNRGLTAERLVKPRVTAGTTVDDILNSHENDF